MIKNVCLLQFSFLAWKRLGTAALGVLCRPMSTRQVSIACCWSFCFALTQRSPAARPVSVKGMLADDLFHVTVQKKVCVQQATCYTNKKTPKGLLAIG